MKGLLFQRTEEPDGRNMKQEKGRMGVMGNRILTGARRLLCVALAICLALGGSFVGNTGSVEAASTRKCYTLVNYNINVYSNTGLTQYYGKIFPTDEITVLNVTNRFTQVRYPISGGRTKTGYIATNLILTGTGGPTRYAKARITTYRRDSQANSYGYVSAGDQVTVLGTRGAYTQIKYPVSGGYKYACITTSNANAYLSATKGNNITVVNPSQNNNLGLCSPVPAGCKFSKKTYDGGWYGFHDINRNVSTSKPVYAIADGTVTYKQAYRTYGGVKYLTSYGNFIEFRASNGGYTAKYCHLSRFVGANQIISSARTKRVSGNTGLYVCGSRSVRRGEVIGYIGTTGNSSGTHLHFELRKNGTRIDPTSVIGGLY